MKKVFLILLVLATLIPQCVFAESDVWNIVDKDFENGIDYSSKVGDYFFRFESQYSSEAFKEISYLCYSTDGVTYTKTAYQTGVFPIFSNGMYFIFDTSMRDVPENKRTNGFNNAPSYVLDAELNVSKTFNDKFFMEYMGCYNGWHYISCIDYTGIIYENNNWNGERKDTIYKTSDGINYEIVNDSENLDFVNGTVLYNSDLLTIEYNSDNSERTVLATPEGNFDVLYETDLHHSYIYDKSLPLMSMYAIIGKKETESIDGKIVEEDIEQKYLTMDGIYGVEMPEDIGRYCFELNGNFYFDKDDEHYYCISSDKLKNHKKVIYNRNILAFATPPETEADRTLVPMRFLFEQMGADVDWDNETQTATVMKGSETISFSIDNTTAIVNNIKKVMDVPARLINDKTLIPLRFLSEELGYNVEWIGETQTIIISKD